MITQCSRHASYENAGTVQLAGSRHDPLARETELIGTDDQNVFMHSVGSSLLLKQEEEVNIKLPLVYLGMDSLIGIELRGAVAEAFTCVRRSLCSQCGKHQTIDGARRTALRSVKRHIKRWRTEKNG